MKLTTYFVSCLVLCGALSTVSIAFASTGAAALAHRQYATFNTFLNQSLSGKGKKTFDAMTAKTRNKIQWRNGQGTNIYEAAFKRSTPFVHSADLQGMPEMIFLLAYLESQWQGKKGDKSGDYGYWQMIPEVIKEIQLLPYVPAKIRTEHIDRVREDAVLSTQAAQAHLHRYHFYFANVAHYPQSEAWLFTLQSFNWGAGNVKRTLASLKSEGIKPNFANFYQRLYEIYSKNPNDTSLRAAVEYVPNLWNIARLLESRY